VAARTGRFERADRLRRSAEFARVIRRGRRVAGSSFVVVAMQREADAGRPTGNRLGITVSRRVGRAVVRNRVKRRIREWFRGARGEFGSGLDLVVIGRPSAAQLPAARAADELTRLGRSAAREAARGDGA
jgi:ribonuclease P protein component